MAVALGFRRHAQVEHVRLARGDAEHAVAEQFARDSSTHIACPACRQSRKMPRVHGKA